MSLRKLFRKRRAEQELDAELRFHLERQIEANIARGMRPPDARRQALVAFGGVDQIKEECRDTRGLAQVESLLQDLRYGLRMLRRSPGFTTVAMLSLALGIGANTAIFSLIDALMLRMLPIRNPEQLVLVTAVTRQRTKEFFSYPLYELLRDNNQVFSGVLAFPTARVQGRTIRAGAGEISEPAAAQLVSGNYFSVLGADAVLGRTLTQDDDAAPGTGGSQGAAAVISYGYWKRKFALDPSVVGKTITLNRRVPFTIVGVTPPQFSGTEVGQQPELYIPVATLPHFVPNLPYLTSPHFGWLRILARLKPGVSRQQARAALEPLFNQHITETARNMKDPTERREVLSWRLELVTAATGTSGLRRQFSKQLFILMGVVGLVLLIACANIANLLLARSAARQKEIAVRLAIGAGRGRLVRQLLTESVLLATLGGSLGLLFAYWGSDLLVTFLSDQASTIALNLRPNSHILSFTGAVCLLTGILFGLAPALQATRPGSIPTSGVALSPLRPAAASRLLVVLQVALSLLLLIGAGLFVRTLRNLQTLDPGFQRENVLLFSIEAPDSYKGIQRTNLHQGLLERVSAIPGVRSASIAWAPPVTGGWGTSFSVEVEGYPARSDEDMTVFTNMVGPRYFETLGAPLLMGREFGPQDGPAAPRVAIINESMARRFWSGRDPLGTRLRLFHEKEQRQVIGVVKDVKYMSLRERDQPVVYSPYFEIGGGTFVVRTEGLPPAALASALRHQAQAVARDVNVADVRTLDNHVNRSLLQERLIAALSSFFGLLALLLVCLGLYGVMSYTVARRTSEIGLRMALGAERGHVIWLVLRETLLLVLLGVAIGLPVALAAVRFVTSMLFGLTPADPVTISLAIFLILMVAALAGYLPASRASRVDDEETTQAADQLLASWMRKRQSDAGSR